MTTNYHRFRVSATKQQDIVETSLAINHELLDHFNICVVCDDTTGLCSIGQEVLNRRSIANRELRFIGVEGCEFE